MNTKKIIEEFERKWLTKSNGYVGNPQKTKRLLQRVGRMLSKEAFGEVMEDMKCMVAYVRDITNGHYKDYSVANLAFAVAVLVYVVSPLDVIPDFLVGLGYGDDAFLVGWAFRQLHEELSKYRHWAERRAAAPEDLTQDESSLEVVPREEESEEFDNQHNLS